MLDRQILETMAKTSSDIICESHMKGPYASLCPTKVAQMRLY